MSEGAHRPPARSGAGPATHAGEASAPTSDDAGVLDRYEVLEEIASGGMATVHLGRVLDEGSDGRALVAVKRMHPQFARDPDFRSMFLDEARVCRLIRHPNVVRTLDVAEVGGDLLLVMELVEGEALSRLVRPTMKRGARVPHPIAGAVLRDALLGLHAAHEATNESGEPLQIVHRDFSPHNVMVGVDGVGRVLDFGVAKARGRMQQTQQGQLKGKLAYMSPEQARGKSVDRRSDVFSAGVVLWELLTGTRLFEGESEAMVLSKILMERVPAPSTRDVALAPFDPIVMRALELAPEDRFASAAEMAEAVASALGAASREEVGSWVKAEAKSSLARRTALSARRAGEPASDAGGERDVDDASPRSPKVADAPRAASVAPRSSIAREAKGALPPPRLPPRPLALRPSANASASPTKTESERGDPAGVESPPARGADGARVPMSSDPPGFDPEAATRVGMPAYVDRPEPRRGERAGDPSESAPAEMREGSLLAPPAAPPSSDAELARYAFTPHLPLTPAPSAVQLSSAMSTARSPAWAETPSSSWPAQSDPMHGQSQVSSVNLISSDVAPPLSPERVRALFWIGVATAACVAGLLGGVLVLVSRGTHEPSSPSAAHSAHPASGDEPSAFARDATARAALAPVIASSAGAARSSTPMSRPSASAPTSASAAPAALPKR